MSGAAVRALRVTRLVDGAGGEVDDQVAVEEPLEVRVNGRIVRDPGLRVVPETAALVIDGVAAAAPATRTIALHKPRGVVTTRRDPEGRPTVYALIAEAGDGLAPAGRLDLASTGLLLCTNDTRFGAWLTDPDSRVEREYVVTVRGELTPEVAG